MKKVFKITFSFVLIAILVASIFSFNIAAASATTHFSPSKTDFTVGEEITVTIKIDAGIPVASIEGELRYDNTIVQLISCDTANNNGHPLKVAQSYPSTPKEVSISAVFKIVSEGKCNFSFSGFCVDGNLTPHNVSTGYFINVKNPATSSDTSSTTSSNPTPSANANLASLKVSGATLSPKFNSNTTSYTVTVPFTTDKVTISAGVADAGATLVGAGTISLNVGDNKRTITVTAASGAKKSYNLVIKRLAEEQVVVPPTDDTDPLLITAEGTNRKVMQDITSMPVPESFSATTAEVNGVQVGALTEPGEKYTLYYTTLEDGSDAALYYKDENAEYKRLRYIEVNGKFYIIADMPQGFAPDGWYKDTMSITGGPVSAFRSENALLKDFYVLYCYSDGAYGFYRFDSLKTTIQRAPDFKLDTFSSDENVDPPKKESIFKRFANMNPTGKAVIILIAIAVICIAVLAVLLILRLTDSEKDQDDGLFIADDDEYETQKTKFDFILDEAKETEKSDKEW